MMRIRFKACLFAAWFCHNIAVFNANKGIPTHKTFVSGHTSTSPFSPQMTRLVRQV